MILEKHEYKTVLLFTEMGVDIELIPKSEKRGVRAPDIVMNGLRWEMKSPKGEGKYLMQNTIQKAVKQSRNVIVDLRRAKRSQERCLQELEKEFGCHVDVVSSGIEDKDFLNVIEKDKKVLYAA